MLQTVREFSTWGLAELGLPAVPVSLSMQCPDASALSATGFSIEWNPAFLAQRTEFELRVITAHEVGHIYSWSVGAVERHHERLADVVAGWLARRSGLLLPSPNDMTALARVLGLVPTGDYRTGSLRLQDLLLGWSHGEDPVPPTFAQD